MNKSDLILMQIQHAYYTVAHYKKTFDEHNICLSDPESIHRVPLLSKCDVLMNEDSFISSDYMCKYQKGDLLIKRTSGSTGKCLNVYWLPSDYYATNIEAWKYRSEWYGISIKDRYAKFHSSLYINGSVVRTSMPVIKKGQTISFDKMKLNEENIHLYLTELQLFKPVWMTIQPSVLNALLSCATDAEVEMLNGLKYVEFISEFLQINSLNYFKKMLPDVTFGDLYGTTETGCISLKCPCGNHHILDNVAVEIFNDDFSEHTDEEGNIVLTTLKNSAMPFIRYCIGDRGRLNFTECKCGFKGSTLSLTMGREYDIIDLPNGERRHSSILWQIIEEVLDEYPEAITQFYVTQKGSNVITFHLSITGKYNNWKRSIEKSMKTAFAKWISPEMDCCIDYDNSNLNDTHNKCNIFTKYSNTQSK